MKRMQIFSHSVQNCLVNLFYFHIKSTPSWNFLFKRRCFRVTGDFALSSRIFFVFTFEEKFYSLSWKISFDSRTSNRCLSLKFHSSKNKATEKKTLAGSELICSALSVLLSHSSSAEHAKWLLKFRFQIGSASGETRRDLFVVSFTSTVRKFYTATHSQILLVIT